MLEYIQRLIGLRREHAALRRGSYHELYARDGVYAFARELQGECFLVVGNVNRRSAQFEISTDVLPELRGEFHDLLSGLSARVAHERLITLSLPARSGSVFRQL